jgi:carbon monoxide dehydrogenase subunit G
MVRAAPDRYEGKMRVGVGAITAAEFELTVTLTDVVEPERYTLQIDGRGRFGFARGSAWVRLEDGGASTVMRYRGDLQVGGKIAGVGQRLLDSIGKLMTRQGLEAVAREVDQRLGAGPGDEGRAGAPPAGGGTAP